jgi:glucose/mannose-6-phosphate isomerase
MQWPQGGNGTMLALVADLPRQLAASGRLEGLASIQPSPTVPRQLLVCGMGGSAVAAELIAPLLDQQSIRLSVWRDYGLPGWVDRRVPVIAASYSGDTEETLAATAAARERGCRVIALTTGGSLAALAGADRSEEFSLVRLPAGLPPRAALGHGLGALVQTLGRLGVDGGLAAQLDTAVGTLDAGNREHLAGIDPTTLPADIAAAGTADTTAAVRALAETVAGRFVVIYTCGAEAHGAGSRLKAQLNENAKCPAYHARFPELDHNDIVGWQLAAAERDRFALVVLRGGGPHAADRRRLTATLAELREDLPLTCEVGPRGEQPLARTLSLVQWGDYFSCYVALARGVDPLPVARIDRLKQALARDDHG